MTTIDTCKEKLLTERELLKKELATVGNKNPEIENDWEPAESDLNVPEADWNERADQMENYSENAAINNELELQLREVEEALVRIDNGVFGVCERCGSSIEEARLYANPSSRTCTNCM